MTSDIWEPEQRRKLFRDISQDVRNGYVVMVIYPGKEVSDGSTRNGKVYSVKEFADTWERQFPGKVAICHGGLSDEENDAAVAAARSLEKPVLIATSIIEVGIDVPRVRRVVVVQPERFGLATLHQLRGRAAPEGGEGFCELVLVGEVTPRAHARLDFLSKHADGFRLAEYDLDDRGGGDEVADGHKQSGQLPTSPFTGYQPSQDVVSAIAAELADVYQNSIPPSQ